MRTEIRITVYSPRFGMVDRVMDFEAADAGEEIAEIEANVDRLKYDVLERILPPPPPPTIVEMLADAARAQRVIRCGPNS